MRAAVDPPLPRLRVDAGVERVWLDETSWVDVRRGWIDGADVLYDRIVEQTAWQQGRVFRYERYVDEPRLGGYWHVGNPPAHPVMIEAQRALQHHYRVRFDGCALAWYRDGRDSVAFHRDREMRWLEDTVIGVLSLGTRRPWLLRPRANRYRHDLEELAHGATHDFSPGGGDLLVLGGRCQADWEHAVPKVNGRTGGRISLQWRYTSKRGRPEVGGNYRDARLYSR